MNGVPALSLGHLGRLFVSHACKVAGFLDGDREPMRDLRQPGRRCRELKLEDLAYEVVRPKQRGVEVRRGLHRTLRKVIGA